MLIDLTKKRKIKNENKILSHAIFVEMNWSRQDRLHDIDGNIPSYPSKQAVCPQKYGNYNVMVTNNK